ncbi:hypothetical protein AL036_07350 [Salipiger aestuarii]|uniref:DUF6882 domain-containing protein n=1 Tax=Salipiger aestuarii TaxID=568098 RepID=UPI00025B69F4|nr:DUF6882 domain-containing protein [Salipiger aestuarii]EIE51512.1 hypothetical protein C357_08346 [Citreicella sp. 357]KAA8608469.1 hypothetical protein AL036_07350 [Salipiger aestuarii]KAA8612253.1 hypothetical protein AL037_07415 [Salipiger aestuarii]
MTRPDKTGLEPARPPQPSWGDYAGEGIWSYHATNREIRELAMPARVRDLMTRVAEGYVERLPALYTDWSLDDPRGQWEAFPEQQVFRVTTVKRRVWYARYGLLSSWNHETHSWLWAWAFPKDWKMPAGVVAPAWALHREAARKGWAAGLEPSLLVNEGEAMRLACLAAHVSGLPLIYRARVNAVNTQFFVLEQPVWAS